MSSTANQNKPRREKCAYIKSDGNRCGTWSLSDSKYCFHHEPSKSQERKQAKSKGGKARHGRVVLVESQHDEIKIESMRDIMHLLEVAINDTLKMENSVSRNNLLGRLASYAIKGYEISELERRLEMLEARQKAIEESKGTKYEY